MKYSIIGDSDTPIVNIDLGMNETIKVESGGMVYMQDVVLKGETNSKSSGFGGLVKAIARSAVSGESMFITKATGTANDARIGVAPAVPGKIACIKVGGSKQYRLNTGAFLACDDSVYYNIQSQSLGRAMFGGTGGLFIMETEGEGEMLVNAFGDLIEMEVTPDRPLIIDNEHVVVWDASLNYDLQIASGALGIMTGEGIVNKFTGSGKVIIQTRNIHSLADEIRKFIPTQSSN